jgi:single-stranded DNA-binding protein
LFIMAFVRVEQRRAHLAGTVRLHTVEGRDGPISRETLTAISNAWRGPGDNRGEEATAIQWTLWGKHAENVAQYPRKGSHVNVVGRVQNNNYDKDGETVYTMAFTNERSITSKRRPRARIARRCARSRAWHRRKATARRMRSPPPARVPPNRPAAARPPPRRALSNRTMTSCSDVDVLAFLRAFRVAPAIQNLGRI